MECQSGCPLKSVNFAYFPGANLDSACPVPEGSASMWALMEGPHATKILVSTKNTAIPVWPNECNLAKVHAHAKDLDEFDSGTSRDRR